MSAEIEGEWLLELLSSETSLEQRESGRGRELQRLRKRALMYLRGLERRDTYHHLEWGQILTTTDAPRSFDC